MEEMKNEYHQYSTHPRYGGRQRQNDFPSSPYHQHPRYNNYTKYQSSVHGHISQPNRYNNNSNKTEIPGVYSNDIRNMSPSTLNTNTDQDEIKSLFHQYNIDEWISSQNYLQQSIIYKTIGLEFDLSYYKSRSNNNGWSKGQSFEQQHKRVTLIALSHSVTLQIF